MPDQVQKPCPYPDCLHCDHPGCPASECRGDRVLTYIGLIIDRVDDNFCDFHAEGQNEEDDDD